MRAFEALLKKVSVALEKKGIPYMVIGGQAVLIHGEPRFTSDIDITLGVLTDQAERVFEIARALSLRPRKGVTKEFVSRNALLSVEDKKTRIVIDFIFSSLPYERQAIKRARPVRVGGSPVVFATAEDTIIHKMFSGRPLDIQDVKTIVSNTKSIDRVYLKKWLKEFSVIAGRDLVGEYRAIETEVKK